MATETVTIEILRAFISSFRVRFVELWRRVLRLSRPAPKSLRLCESLPLGEHRFVAVIEFDAARFLLGGTSSSLVLLSRLGDADDLAAGRPQERPMEVNDSGHVSEDQAG